MRLPFADELSPSLRRVGRRLIGDAETRSRIAAWMQHLAHLPARRHPDFRRSSATLARLKDIHRGETCVIIGNGPSIAGEDFSKLAGVSTFCLNRGYLMWNEQGLVPTYYVAVNDLVIEQFSDEIARIACPLFLPWTHHKRFPGQPNATFLEMRWQKRFFPDAADGVWAGATVTFVAMQLAYHMGFSRVVLIGVDHRFEDEGLPHTEVVQTADDANHFSPQYFGKGVRWNLPDLEQSLYAYRLAKEAFEADHRSIADATRRGALQLFPKTTLEAALSNLREERGGRRLP